MQIKFVNMKGISPIVASVLLIAITMTIAGVLAFWSSTFVSQALPIENASISQCRVAQFEFVTCKYNSTSQIVVFSLNNVRTADLGNMTAFIEYANGTISNGASLNQSLPANTIKSYTISGIPPDFANLLVKTGCPDVSRSTACTR